MVAECGGGGGGGRPTGSMVKKQTLSNHGQPKGTRIVIIKTLIMPYTYM